MPMPLTAFEVAELPRHARFGRIVIEFTVVAATVLVAILFIIAWGNQ